MANINEIPSSLFGNSGDDFGNNSDILNEMLLELLRDLSLNKNFFTTDLSDSEDEEILEAFGYKLYKVSVTSGEGMSGTISIALPNSLSDTEVKRKLKTIKTFEQAFKYYPKTILEQENRKLYVKLIKKLINDCNS